MTKQEELRYSRHLLLDGFGKEGQERLRQGKVLIIGAGGLGSPCAMYLASSGVGTIGIVDGDTVSISNLQRQIIHFTGDIGTLKVDSAKEKLEQINPDAQIVTYPTFLTQDNALDIMKDYDFIVDCTDSFASKYLVTDACVLAGKPFCAGGVIRYGGQVMSHVPGTACYRCIFPEPPAINQVDTCSSVGVLSSAVGIMGSIQASEAIKYLTGIGELLTDSLLVFDTLTMEFNTLSFHNDEHCHLCGTEPSITSLQEYSFKPCRRKE